jgi:hypothetical protein
MNLQRSKFPSMQRKKKSEIDGFLPSTMARVFVAFRSFFADDFSRFFFDALFTL